MKFNQLSELSVMHNVPRYYIWIIGQTCGHLRGSTASKEDGYLQNGGLFKDRYLLQEGQLPQMAMDSNTDNMPGQWGYISLRR